MKLIVPTEDYLEKARLLSKDDAERLQARMRGKFTRRIEDKKLSAIEAVALQLQYEDEELSEWRQKVSEIREKHKSKQKD